MNAGEALYRVHAEFPANFQFAHKLAQQDSGYRLGTRDEVTDSYLEI